MQKASAKRMNSEERKRQILESAMKVFIEKGYKGSTTVEIAKAANISEVTLFRYFSSKQEIFLEGIRPILLTNLKETIDTSNHLTPKEKLEQVFYERINMISQNHEIIKLILMEASLLNQWGNENFMEGILKVFRDLIEEIGIPKDNQDIALRLIMGSILSFLFMPNTEEEYIKNYAKKISSEILIECKNK